jgi:hypothetical protein
MIHGSDCKGKTPDGKLPAGMKLTGHGPHEPLMVILSVQFDPESDPFTGRSVPGIIPEKIDQHHERPVIECILGM